MKTTGTLVLKMFITIPDERKPKHKFMVVARKHCCTFDEAKAFRAEFIEANPIMAEAIIDGEWVLKDWV